MEKIEAHIGWGRQSAPNVCACRVFQSRRGEFQGDKYHPPSYLGICASLFNRSCRGSLHSLQSTRWTDSRSSLPAAAAFAGSGSIAVVIPLANRNPVRRHIPLTVIPAKAGIRGVHSGAKRRIFYICSPSDWE
ncbi:MAG: hypothetical protein LBI87_14900 [Candidatus Accumulibacter sp.]|nr:hypothetical protein [Accumulibacter sp.]